MNIEIDPYSGFCFGVINAIDKAEKLLDKGILLYCLGDLVHNNHEMERLQQKGLRTIQYNEFKQMKNVTVLIRAHGEPPETYEIAKKNNITLVDATCPVVLRLQKKIKQTYEQNEDVQIIIFGKQGHAEVNGLVGQTKGNAIVINSIDDLDKIDFTRPVAIFSQTTQSPDKYATIVAELKKRMAQHGEIEKLECVNSICRQVSVRDKELKKFAQKHDVIIFVSGKQSSNGKALFEVCQSANSNSYFISNSDEIKFEWFSLAKSVGICGATSTPRWLMEKIANYIKNNL
ncbi:MAG: 4-hydroxy-3-methylbut-2-enyl diphosphate reductase [Bacteroidales bacterium]|nr:4-hydroxy-3-methylbut-2-enyl diphosphate reductase [Bacteroidales bacterium]